MRYHFIAAEHEEYGGIGWSPVWVRDADPCLSGMTVAHDILEHFPSAGADVIGELQAIGAMFYIRGVGGYWHQINHMRPDPGYHASADIPDIFRHVVDESMPFECPKGGRRRLSEEIEDWIGDGLADTEEIRDIDFPIEWESFKSHAARWIRIGYRRAVRRYRGIDPYSISTLFLKIQKGIDSTLREEVWPGMELTVSLDIQNQTVRIWTNDY